LAPLARSISHHAHVLTPGGYWCDRSGESFDDQLDRARALYREERNPTEKWLANKLA
jgi:hypothetical protein